MSIEEPMLAGAPALQVTLFTRAGCHLCDEAKAVMQPLLARFGATLKEVNVDGDEGLRERYGNDVPVIFLGARKIAKHRVDARQFERQLAGAAQGR